MAREQPRVATRGLLGRLGNAIKTRPWPAWTTARLVSLAVGLVTWGVNRGNVFVDITGYGRWAFGALDGTRIPYQDFFWEYPPMAMPGMLVPAVVSAPLPTWGFIPYLVAWIAMLLAIDALILRMLLVRVGSGIRHPALLMWILGPPLLGALSWTRFDMLAALAAFVTVLYAGERKGVVSGLAAGVGATLKLWPSLLAPVQRTRVAAVVATAVAMATVGVVAGVTRLITGSTGFDQVLTYQSDRGLQIESLAALPLVWANHFGVEGFGTRFAFGAFEITGPGVEQLAALSTVLFWLVLAVVFLAHWRLMRRDAGGRGVALTAVALLLAILVTNKVFSPQYVLWLVAVVAVGAALDPPTWKRFVAPVLWLCGLTALVFPIFYGDILADGWIGLIAITVRDLLLIWLFVMVAFEFGREVRSVRQADREHADDSNPNAEAAPAFPSSLGRPEPDPPKGG